MSGSILSILLVEDNPADADLLQEILDEVPNYTWKITHVKQLSAAIQILHLATFDIVFSDLSLPDAQGLDSVVQLCTEVPGLPVIVLTGLSDETMGLEALRQGAQDYLIKGHIQADMLVRTIRYAIERSQTQRVLRQQSAAMAASTEGIAILNVSREIIYVNQAFSKLHTCQQMNDLIGTTLEALYHQDRYTSLWELIEPTIREQGYWQGEVASHRHQHQLSYQELLITPLVDGGYVCNIRDITERKQAEIEVLQALEREKELNELKANFVTLVSHEFRTPLTTILSSVELIQKYGHHISSEKNQVRLHRIVNGVHRMTQLLNDVLIFNQAEVGQLSFQPSSLDVESFCQSLIEEIKQQLNLKHQLIFINQISSKSFYLDQKLLNHILLHLITNAIKYSPENTKITLRVCDASQHISFYVSDQGIGIPPTDLDRLFVLFHRASNVGTIPGTGLGLAIVKQCVDLHGGSIDVTSQVNQGSEFKITIPNRLGA